MEENSKKQKKIWRKEYFTITNCVLPLDDDKLNDYIKRYRAKLEFFQALPETESKSRRFYYIFSRRVLR